MAEPPLKINETTVKTPHDMTIERYNLTKAGRTADGKMHMDYIARKRRLTVAYRAIRDKELQELLDVIDPGRNEEEGEENNNNQVDLFFDVEYQEGGKTKSMVCYAGMIPSTLQRRVKNGLGEWVWIDVEFNLIER